MNLCYQYTNSCNTIRITEDDDDDDDEENYFDGTVKKKFEMGNLINMESFAFQLHYWSQHPIT